MEQKKQLLITITAILVLVFIGWICYSIGRYDALQECAAYIDIISEEIKQLSELASTI
jgi:hypothetical protein